MVLIFKRNSVINIVYLSSSCYHNRDKGKILEVDHTNYHLWLIWFYHCQTYSDWVRKRSNVSIHGIFDKIIMQVASMNYRIASPRNIVWTTKFNSIEEIITVKHFLSFVHFIFFDRYFEIFTHFGKKKVKDNVKNY